MDLQTQLTSVRSLADLPRLVSALGHEALLEEVPPEGWNRGADGKSPLTVVGRTGTLPWFAIESRSAERRACILAGRLSRRGRVSIVLALDPEARRLIVTVALGRLPSIELNLAHPEPEAVASLAKLAGRPEGGPLAFAVQAADALAAETVGRRFFREFRETLDRIAAGLPGPMHAEDRHGLALLQLTRVLFLYFIQAKGWLGGRDRFLAEQVDHCLARRRGIHRDLLRPLFFGTLNQPAALRSRAAREFGAIPFLNGGLFEPHPLERRLRADISNELWREAFDRLFERFHFIVCEQDRSGRGVAPDMLGRVFEGVMAPAARRASGTFYTPAALVERVLDAALIGLIAARLGCPEVEAEQRMHGSDETVARILRSITLLDPAVGSGAFLLGALERLGGKAGRGSGGKRWVLGHNLFGVDLCAAAVRLTELRLWLAVIADDPAECAESVRPLPNLDCLIRQGDSLFDPVGPGSAAPREMGAQLCGLRREVVTATGPDKRLLVSRLRALEARALGHSLDAAEARHRDQIGECLEQARGGNLFGERRGLDRELGLRLARLRIGLRQVRQARRQLARDGGVPWFHYQSHFADVFAKGGFDLVIGNPPWLRSEQISPEMRTRLGGRYRWWRSRGRGYANGPDLAVAFVERGLELAAPDGVLAMLVPSKLTSAGYGTAARHALASGTTLRVITDLTGCPEAEFDATVYPLALITSKAAPPPGHQVRTTLSLDGEHSVRQTDLGRGGPWILVQSRARLVMAALERNHPRLGERVICHLGLKTGANRLFLNPPDNLEPEMLRWAIRGRDLRPFSCRRRTRLLWTHDGNGQPRPDLPPRAAAYLTPHLSELRARGDFKHGPPWTVFRVRPAVARYRVVWADLARQLTAAALTTSRDLEQIPMNSCYVASARSAGEARCLAAWLNSTWVRIVARVGAVPAASGFARFNAGAIARLPLPDPVLEDPALDRLARAGRGGDVAQEELDELVARHLGLSNSDQSGLRSVARGTQDRR
jgi:hypothetical protein